MHHINMKSDVYDHRRCIEDLTCSQPFCRHFFNFEEIPFLNMDCHNLVLKLFFKIKKNKKKSHVFDAFWPSTRPFCNFQLFFSCWCLSEKIKFKEIYFRCICIHFSFLDYFSFQIEVNVAFHEKTKKQKKIKIVRKWTRG
jgi:hypothetical protein